MANGSGTATTRVTTRLRDVAVASAGGRRSLIRSEVVEALELVIDLWQEGVTPDIGMGTGQTLTGFYATGKLCMTPAGGILGWPSRERGYGNGRL